MLPPEQIQQIKQQLISQLEQSNLPNKEEIKTSIQAMNPEQLKEFLKQNKLIKESGETKCVFCSIAENKTPGYKIDENSESIAVLEINPVSKGHVIIIPKIHSEDAPKQAFDLAEKNAKKISQVFKPQKVDIIDSSLFGHKIINILPVYKNETLHSQRRQAKPEELEEIQKELISQEPEKQEEPKPKPITDKNTWLPKRIP